MTNSESWVRSIISSGCSLDLFSSLLDVLDVEVSGSSAAFARLLGLFLGILEGLSSSVVVLVGGFVGEGLVDLGGVLVCLV
jgi:hypothetical protein